MCVVVYPTVALSENPLEIIFALERVYQRRDGGKNVVVDLLIHNSGQNSISEFHIAYPNALVDPLRAAKKDENAARREVAGLRAEQLSRISVRTHELGVVDRESKNWIYSIHSTVTIDRAACKAGTFVVRREGHSTGPAQLPGYLKQDWTVGAPEHMSEWTWLFYACSGITIVALRAPGIERERLRADESMWLRLEVLVPATLGWRHLQEYFMRSNEHWLNFYSPTAVRRLMIKKVEAFEPDQTSFPRALGNRLAAAVRSAESLLPPDGLVNKVRDWRTFLYREYGLSLESVDHGEPRPKQPRVSATFTLPRAADPKGCSRGPAPIFLQAAIFRGSRDDKALEFSFGLDHDGYADEQGYIIGITARSTNRVYAYLAWLGLAGFLLSCVNIALTLYRLKWR